MKAYIKVWLFLLSLGFTYLITMMLFKNEKVGYVNNVTLVEKYLGMIEVRSQMDNKSKITQSNLDTLINELKRNISIYESSKVKMTAKERALNEQILNNKQKELNQYSKAVQNKLQEEQNSMSQNELSKLNAFIKEYGIAKNYKIIFGANESGNVVYADKLIDLTDEILEGANKAYKKE